jgi:hypothetical protein
LRAATSRTLGFALPGRNRFCDTDPPAGLKRLATAATRGPAAAGSTATPVAAMRLPLKRPQTQLPYQRPQLSLAFRHQIAAAAMAAKLNLVARERMPPDRVAVVAGTNMEPRRGAMATLGRPRLRLEDRADAVIDLSRTLQQVGF